MPLLLRPRNVFGTLAPIERAQGKIGRYRKKELVGNRILVGLGFAPPDPTTTSVVPTTGHIGKDRTCHRKILPAASQIIRIDPCQRPPTFIVVIVIQETTRGFLGLLKGIGKSREILRATADP